MAKTYLAVDIGASFGRHIVGWLENGEIKTEELYRFPNGVTELDGHLTWDIDALLSHVKKGIAIAKEKYPVIESLSIDDSFSVIILKMNHRNRKRFIVSKYCSFARSGTGD